MVSYPWSTIIDTAWSCGGSISSPVASWEYQAHAGQAEAPTASMPRKYDAAFTFSALRAGSAVASARACGTAAAGSFWSSTKAPSRRRWARAGAAFMAK